MATTSNYWFVLAGAGAERNTVYGWLVLDKDEYTRAEAAKVGKRLATKIGEKNFNYFISEKTYITDSIDAFEKKCKTVDYNPNCEPYKIKEAVIETPAPEVTVEEPKIYKNVKEILDNTKLTEKEVVVVKLLNDQLRSYFGEMYSDIDCNDIAKLLEWDVKTVKGVIGSLTKKNIATTWDTGTGYEVISLVNQDEMSFYHFKADEETIPAPAKVKASAKKASGAQPITETVKTTAHKVGDIHKNGKWFWTEYKPGKFDWRNIKVK